jgi:hypothetical protein
MRIKKIIGTEQLSTIDWGHVKIEKNLNISKWSSLFCSKRKI